MTDISKYKNVSLPKETYIKIDKLRQVIVPNAVISRSQTISILVNEKAKTMNGALNKVTLIRKKRNNATNRNT
jgi:hypothetical protein